MAGKAKLDALSWTSLCMKCRSLKEALLTPGADADGSVSIAGRGKSVVGTTMKFTLTRDEISKIIIEGFLNEVDFGSIDKKISSAAGLRESGLPYAEDPSITNQLAKFLKRHVKDIARDSAKKFVRPDKILYNGGVFKSEAIRSRATELVSGWLSGAEGGFTVLDNADYDLSVSLGAAYYAYTKSGSGVRIRSGSARSYYIGVSSGDEGHACVPGKLERAVCVVTRGMEEGRKSSLDAGLSVITNQPVQFALYSSTVNEGAIGDVVEIDDENYIKLPPLFTCLNYGKKSRTPRIDISLSAYLSEVGTIDLYCLSKASEHRWKLQFNFRKHEALTAAGAAASSAEGGGAAEEPGSDAVEEKNSPAEAFNAETLKKAEEMIEAAFGEKGPQAQEKLSGLTRQLESLTGAKKEEWPPDLLRALFAAMLKTADTRRVSAAHEERWFNLAGFLLRPGFGAPMDDWRVKESLRVSFGGVNFKGNKNSVINYYVFLRRIAGGMSAGQQSEVFNRLKEQLYGSKKAGDKPFKVSANNQEFVELLRMAASFELLPEQDKLQLGNSLRKAIRRDGPNTISVWALARVGARRLVYGGPDYVVKPETAENWVNALLEFDWSKEAYIPYSAILMARVTGDRKLDLSAEVMAKIQKQIETCPSSEHLYDLLMNMAAMDENDQRLFFGESLPHGIVISGN